MKLLRALLGLLASLPVVASAQVMPVTQTTSPIDLACVLNRTSGVAPLAINFDCSGSTSANVPDRDNSFLHIEYAFDFGDPNTTPVAGPCGEVPVKGEGFWRCGKRHGLDSKNTQVGGGIAAHIYENPGTFQACITARDGTAVTPAKCYAITVADPDVYFASPTGRTICVSTTGTFTGCPSSNPADHVTFTTFPNIFNATYLASNTRILFRGGETFNSTAHMAGLGAFATTVDIGSFGPGRATFNSTVDDYFFRVGGYPYVSEDGNQLKDWRFHDIDFTFATCTVGNTALRFDTDNTNMLALRLTSNGYGLSTYAQGTNGGVTRILDYAFRVDNVHDDTVCEGLSLSGTPLYGSGIHVSIMGDYIDNRQTGEYTFRFMYSDRGFYSHNTFRRPGNTKGFLQIRAPSFQICGKAAKGDGSPSKCYLNANNKSVYNVVSDNEGTNLGGTQVNMGFGIGSYLDKAPEPGGVCTSRYDFQCAYTTYDHRIWYAVYERNFVHDLQLATQTTTYFGPNGINYLIARNNIADVSSRTGVCISVGRSNNYDNIFGPQQGGINNYIVHNTCYSSSTEAAGTARWGSQINGYAKNNLQYNPNAPGSGLHSTSSGTLPTGTSATGGTQGDSSTAQALSSNPFAAPPTVTNWDSYTASCAPPYTDYPCNQGLSPVPGAIYDGLGNLRTTTDIGAIQHP